MSELSSRLKSSGKLLTAAVWGWNTEGVSSAVYNHVDFLNLMTYDGGVPHSTYTMAESSLNYWKSKGLPKEKMILGIPFYGSNSGWSQKGYSELVFLDSGAPFKDEGGYESVSGFYYNSIDTVKDKTMLAAEKARRDVQALNWTPPVRLPSFTQCASLRRPGIANSLS